MFARRETFIYELQPEGTIKLVFAKKRPGFYGIGPSMNISTPEINISYSPPVGEDYDKIMAEGLEKLEGRGTEPLHFIEMRSFQAVECDTLEEFEFAEVVMEHYILQGKGRSVYDEYANQ